MSSRPSGTAFDQPLIGRRGLVVMPAIAEQPRAKIGDRLALRLQLESRAGAVEGRLGLTAVKKCLAQSAIKGGAVAVAKRRIRARRRGTMSRSPAAIARSRPAASDDSSRLSLTFAMLSITRAFDHAGSSITRAVGTARQPGRSARRLATGGGAGIHPGLAPLPSPVNVLVEYLAIPSKNCRAIRLLCVKSMLFLQRRRACLETGAEVRLILAVHRWRVKLPCRGPNLLAHRLNFSSGNAAATHLM